MIKERLMAIMTRNTSYPIFSAATALWVISTLYGSVMRIRRRLYEKGRLRSYALPCTVVSVGNLAAGGTGKTPMVVHLARLLQRNGYRPAILSRGYKGRSRNRGTLVSDGRRLHCDVRQAGDEPFLMAALLRDVPVAVGKDRYRIGKTVCRQLMPDVILLDDAFQHLRLQRDLNLLLLDARSPLGNTYLIPRGRLREPAAVISAADAIVLTRSESIPAPDLAMLTDLGDRVPVFRSQHRGVIRGTAPADAPLPPLRQLPAGPTDLNDLNLFGFAGLADNAAFFDAVRRQGARLVGDMGFADHHAYGQGDIARIRRAAVDAGADGLVTTDKDYVRIAEKARLPIDVIVLGVQIEFSDDTGRWREFILERVDRLMRRRGE